METRDLFTALRQDFFTAAGFLTRLPLPAMASSGGGDLRRALRLFPLVGAAIGAIGAIAFWLARHFGLDAGMAAVLAVAATALTTGALHEDGLSDSADGLGGGRDAAHKLEIMRDSRLGAYGALALIFSVLLRCLALAAAAEPALAAAALIAAHSASRALLPGLLMALPLARSDGLAAGVGAPEGAAALTALGLGLVIALLALGFTKGLLTLAAAVIAGWAAAWLARRQIHGITGDTLGAAQQAAEIAALVALAAAT